MYHTTELSLYFPPFALNILFVTERECEHSFLVDRHPTRRKRQWHHKFSFTLSPEFGLSDFSAALLLHGVLHRVL